jgi:hypothetical protein
MDRKIKKMRKQLKVFLILIVEQNSIRNKGGEGSDKILGSTINTPPTLINSKEIKIEDKIEKIEKTIEEKPISPNVHLPKKSYSNTVQNISGVGTKKNAKSIFGLGGKKGLLDLESIKGPKPVIRQSKVIYNKNFSQN